MGVEAARMDAAARALRQDSSLRFASTRTFAGLARLQAVKRAERVGGAHAGWGIAV